jgi:ArsR family transcriptional regulator
MEPIERYFKALSDETRLTIVGLIFRHRQLCVCEVEQILGITQSKASRHLRYLRDAGVLEDEREGVTINYRLPKVASPELSAILVLLRGLLATRPFPDVAPLLVQMRAGRSDVEGPRSLGSSITPALA